jgi:serine protease Do
MKRAIWIGLASFFLGVVLAGYVFVYLPDQNAQAKSFLDTPASLGGPLFADSAQEKPEMDFVQISEKVGSAVVRIDAERTERNPMPGFGDEDPFGDFWERFFGTPQSPRRPRQPQNYNVTVQGTGFFISADGYIVTNNHIVENAAKVKVFTGQGEEYQAKVVGTDVLTDVALIKVEAKNAPFAELGDSSKVKVGEWVLAIGNPLGMEHTVTAGIVSAKGRQLGLGEGTIRNYEDFIQTDAAINRGNSGGPLVNMRGEVIGINSNILTPSGGSIGIGFAIPSSMAKKVVLQLKEKGRVVRGKLGVTIASQPIDQDTQKLLNLKTRKGALINSVEEGGPADKAGLKQYDVVVEINGQPVENSADLRMKIADIVPGTKVEIKFVRDGKEMSTPATIVELEPEAQAKRTPERTGGKIGAEVEALNPTLARRYGLRTTRGLVITDVTQGSVAERRGLQALDIIIEANRQKMETVEQWEALLAKIKPGDAILLSVRREGDGAGQDFIVVLRVE